MSWGKSQIQYVVSPSWVVSVVNGESGANFISVECWKGALEIRAAFSVPAIDAG